MAVVGDVAIGHDPIVVTEGGESATIAAASVDGHRLSNGVVITDHQLGALATVLFVLGLCANGGKLEDPVALA